MRIMNSQNENSQKWLIRKSSEDQIYIIVADHQHKESVESLAKELNLYIPEPITLSELLKGELKNQVKKEVLVADIDLITKYLHKAAFKELKATTATAASQLLSEII